MLVPVIVPLPVTVRLVPVASVIAPALVSVRPVAVLVPVRLVPAPSSVIATAAPLLLKVRLPKFTAPGAPIVIAPAPASKSAVPVTVSTSVAWSARLMLVPVIVPLPVTIRLVPAESVTAPALVSVRPAAVLVPVRSVGLSSLRFTAPPLLKVSEPKSVALPASLPSVMLEPVSAALPPIVMSPVKPSVSVPDAFSTALVRALTKVTTILPLLAVRLRLPSPLASESPADTAVAMMLPLAAVIEIGPLKVSTLTRSIPLASFATMLPAPDTDASRLLTLMSIVMPEMASTVSRSAVTPTPAAVIEPPCASSFTSDSVVVPAKTSPMARLPPVDTTVISLATVSRSVRVVPSVSRMMIGAAFSVAEVVWITRLVDVTSSAPNGSTILAVPLPPTPLSAVRVTVVPVMSVSTLSSASSRPTLLPSVMKPSAAVSVTVPPAVTWFT